ncbi:MAG TPA: methyltransferase domain-containing protein [Hyalangium sp.]|nr:methyltransferase domain-containing protein [Hyalangium sp.]
MSEPIFANDGLVQNFETVTQCRELWELIWSASDGEPSARASAVERLKAMKHPASALTQVAVHHAGGEEVRVQCEAHLADEKWAKLIPLRFQEFTPVFPTDTRFHQRIQDAFSESGWAQAHLRALEGEGEAGIRAAQALVGELQTIAQEAAELLSRLKSIRERIKPPLHILQVQALTRAELALGSLKGKKALEVGPQEGELLQELIRLGAETTGVDLWPKNDHPAIVKGDFLHTPLPGPFDFIVATAVFENSSCSRGEQDSDPRNNSREVLVRMRELTAPGAVIVLENVMLPIPFTHEDAEQAGFEVLRFLMPGITLRMGGRSCALRRKP